MTILTSSRWSRFGMPGAESIKYNISRTSHGMRIDVDLPPKVSASDKKKIAEWLFQYRSQVRRIHPFWYTAFRVKIAGEKTLGYSLDITKASEATHIKTAEEQMQLALTS